MRIQRYWLDSGSTLLRQSMELSLNFTHFPREDGLGEMTEIFIAVLGSTAEAVLASLYGAFEEVHTVSLCVLTAT